MPHIIEDILTSNREHNDRMSSGAVCTYDARIEHPEGGWLVNKKRIGVRFGEEQRHKGVSR